MFIQIENIEVEAKHGCYEFEKTESQKFIATVNLHGDFTCAMKDDSLGLTVDYGEAAKLVYDYILNNSFNLIERLAYGVSETLAKKYPYLSQIDVKISKPNAPIEVPFENVSFNLSSYCHTAILSLGSSEGDRSKYLDFAVKSLNKVGLVKKVSSKFESDPYGGVAKNKFLNSAVIVNTFLNPSELLNAIGEIESGAKRERNIHWADRTLDIDIITYDDLTLNTKKLTIPHSDYVNRDFVLYPLKEVAPKFICPKCGKSIDELIADLKKATTLNKSN